MLEKSPPPIGWFGWWRHDDNSQWVILLFSRVDFRTILKLIGRNNCQEGTIVDELKCHWIHCQNWWRRQFRQRKIKGSGQAVFFDGIKPQNYLPNNVNCILLRRSGDFDWVGFTFIMIWVRILEAIENYQTAAEIIKCQENISSSLKAKGESYRQRANQLTELEIKSAKNCLALALEKDGKIGGQESLKLYKEAAETCLKCGKNFPHVQKELRWVFEICISIG